MVSTDPKTARSNGTNTRFLFNRLVKSSWPGLGERETTREGHHIKAFCVFLCAPHSTCLWGFHMQLLAQRWTAQIPFQPSSCQTLSTCLTQRTHRPVQSQPNTFTVSRQCDYTHTHTHTYLCWCSPGNPRTACWQLVSQRTGPLLTRSQPSPASPLPCCTVCCHL